MPSRRWKNESSLKLRIGLHSGDTIVDNVGSGDRMNYTAMGDSVNLASRLESAGKVYQRRIIVSESTKEQCDDSLHFRILDYIRVRGRREGCKIYELVNKTDELSEKDRAISESYARAFDAYQQQDWQQATEILQELIDEHKNFKPARVLLNSCSDFLDTPPDNWDGLFDLK